MNRSVLALATLAAVAAVSTGSASAHSSPCHLKKECPSDHASYRWKGSLCVKPTSPERKASFSRKITFRGRTYYCK